MANALYLVWDRPMAGKEGASLELFSSVMGYWEKKRKEGLVESYEAVLLGAHGGYDNGFILVRCARDKLETLRKDDEFFRLNVRANVILKGFGVIEAYVGDEVTRAMKTYRETI